MAAAIATGLAVDVPRHVRTRWSRARGLPGWRLEMRDGWVLGRRDRRLEGGGDMGAVVEDAVEGKGPPLQPNGQGLARNVCLR